MDKLDNKARKASQLLCISAFPAPRRVWASHPLIGPPLRPGTLGTVGQYELLNCIGEGGMGLVFSAREVATSRTVAIKLVKPSITQDKRAVAFFCKETKLLQNLNHPNILCILERGQGEGGGFIVMPWVKPGSAQKLIVTERPLPKRWILRIASQIASALAYAHSQGIIHHDIKPQNILIDKNDRVYLTDFGLALSLGNEDPISIGKQEVIGTPAFFSPARARGEFEDTREDIYAFGALLYAFLTGRPPYHGVTHQEIINKINAGPPTPIRQLVPTAPLDLVRICEIAMARDMGQRYVNMSSVIQDLDTLQDALPTVMEPRIMKNLYTVYACTLKSTTPANYHVPHRHL